MNAKQSLRAAAKHIEDLSDWNRRASRDIKAYNACIDGVIDGQCSFCDWCEEQEECQRECKGTGCGEWWLKDNPPIKEEPADDSKGAIQESQDSGTGN